MITSSYFTLEEHLSEPGFEEIVTGLGPHCLHCGKPMSAAMTEEGLLHTCTCRKAAQEIELMESLESARETLQEFRKTISKSNTIKKVLSTYYSEKIAELTTENKTTGE